VSQCWYDILHIFVCIYIHTHTSSSPNIHVIVLFIIYYTKKYLTLKKWLKSQIFFIFMSCHVNSFIRVRYRHIKEEKKSSNPIYTMVKWAQIFVKEKKNEHKYIYVCLAQLVEILHIICRGLRFELRTPHFSTFKTCKFLITILLDKKKTQITI